MTWLRNLYDTYEHNQDLIGIFEKKENEQEFALIPVAHMTQTAHIEVAVDEKGEFISAKVVDKNDASTIIPCTEESASRTSKAVPHPLCDKLMYVAGDYVKYGGGVKNSPYNDYLKQLKTWCASEYVHPKVESVYTYLGKGTLIEDLINEKIIYVDEHNKFIEKWSTSISVKYGDKPALFGVLSSDSKQSDAFVRFSVNMIGDSETRLWRDKEIHESFIAYYENTLSGEDLCYVTGEQQPSTERHAKGIRYSGDNAKLICKNKHGLTYLGRFKNSNEAVSISYEVSQKAHNALKWLIAKQGYSIDGRVFLVWGTQQLEIPSPLEDTLGLYGDIGEANLGDMTHKEFANQVKKAITGYKHDLNYLSDVIIMIVDAATPGRMSIVYYRDMDKNLFLERLESWHRTCNWLHRYKKDDNKVVIFRGAPATKDIAFAAYGSKANEKIVKGLIERMLPSILDGRKIPVDIIRSACNRASNPIGLDKWEWEKTLSITCALINKQYEGEGYSVGLDVNNDNRDYLFGRLLAVADVLERSALDKEEKRATNAIRYMNAFAQHPQRTWSVIQSNIQPYQAKLGTRLGYYNKIIDEIGSKIRPEDFTDKPLSGLYLLGFYSQRYELYQGKKETHTEEGEM